LKRLGDWLEALWFAWDEFWRPKPKELTQREIEEAVRRARFERYVLGKRVE
jgi:hypothetical protein